jgi:hypothetical protein
MRVSPFTRRLRRHFGANPTQLPVVSETFPEHDHPNLQMAMDGYLAEQDRSAQIVGIVAEHAFMGVNLASLVGPRWSAMPASEGPVEYVSVLLAGDRVLILTGRSLGLIEQSCAMARVLQPSIVILEDVDLIAEERTRRPGGCASPLLFELLNQMDGLADDADVLFLLTTNRPDLLEPALAARPGRIDQAIEIPLPDELCRRRLFGLYSQGLTLQLGDLTGFVHRTEGASPAFIRELMRKAALFAADEPGELIVNDPHLEEALYELTVQGGELTRSLLGYRPGAKSPDEANGDNGAATSEP